MDENKRPTQCEQLIEHFHHYDSITSDEAKARYGIARLASRMNELKNQGYKFHKRMIKDKNRYGVTVSYAEYIKGE